MKDRQQHRQQRLEHPATCRLPPQKALSNPNNSTRPPTIASEFRRQCRPLPDADKTASAVARGIIPVIASFATVWVVVGLVVVWSHRFGGRISYQAPPTTAGGFVWLRETDGAPRKHRYGRGAAASGDPPQDMTSMRKSRVISVPMGKIGGDEVDTITQVRSPESFNGPQRVSSSGRHADTRGKARESISRSGEGIGHWGEGSVREDGAATREASVGGRRDLSETRGASLSVRPLNVRMRALREGQSGDTVYLEVLGHDKEEDRSAQISNHGGNGMHPVELPVEHYENFETYATEQSARGRETLPVPFVSSPGGPEASRSIPLAIIIGVQKGGTQNLRSHLLTHPSLSGMDKKEAHFFDWYWLPDDRTMSYEWPGDGHGERELSPRAVGDLLSAYADRTMKAVAPSDRDTKATVDSTPVYIFHPPTPYRMKMILPEAKLVVILRDPTERYFSHLRMFMCWTSGSITFETLQQRLLTYFHKPGKAKEYLEQGEASYEPYTSLCRGENATERDLERCWESMARQNPLHRGLYADQLERWFRVYDRSQILVVESSEMFRNFTNTIHRVAKFIGLPPHNFSYDSSHQHSTSECESRRPELFAEDEMYDKMLEDEDVLREWYRPHNQRLYRLLGRDMPWE